MWVAAAIVAAGVGFAAGYAYAQRKPAAEPREAVDLQYWRQTPDGIQPRYFINDREVTRDEILAYREKQRCTTIRSTTIR
jgi:hypothetical protein